MATVVLQAVGSAVGGFFGGPFGAALGRALGGYAGYQIDQRLLSKDQVIEGPRLEGTRILASDPTAGIPRAYGQVRLGGQVIWATRFREVRKREKAGGGGKGGGGSKSKVTTYTYYCSFAVGLCEGPVAHVRRVWADGKILDLNKVEMRFHNGAPDQAPDPLIEAKQGSGNTPAYRNLAYLVFEDLPLKKYGNRIPQITVEVVRPVSEVAERTGAVAIIPGSTEHGYDPKPGFNGPNRRYNTVAPTDWEASIDELQATCPNLKSVSLIVSWFGNDLRAGECELRPGVEHRSGSAWAVSGIGREDAHLVSRDQDGNPAYGGTPSDDTVVRAIQDLKARGLKVTLYPFILMDVPPGNAFPDPYGEPEQAAYPWRGRITCYPGKLQANSADKTNLARLQVEAFAGGVLPHFFTPEGQGTHSPTVNCAAPEWSFRRLVLHYAHLAALAGGVDGFVIGSEMRELTTLRDEAGAFPFVEKLSDLARDVRPILGAQTVVTYAADWSEYFGYQPADGSGDRLFHLDPLWAHQEIDAVGIDNYMPVSDWRDEGDPLASAKTIHDLAYLKDGIATGEGADWYYASDDDRRLGNRSAITDGQGEPWIYRYKDLVSWWSNPHHDRLGGVRQSAPTDWIPQSKPFLFTELGAAAIDKAANQPNLFQDPKSAESNLPHFSSGGRDDLIQNRFIRAHQHHWSNEGAGSNPISNIYSGPMVNADDIALWAWDARPYPWFPELSDVWGDTLNWARGHWLNGRLSGCPVDELIAKILRDAGFEDFDIKADGWVDGFILPGEQSARATLEPLLSFFGISVSEMNGRLQFRGKGYAESLALDAELISQEGDDPKLVKKRNHDLELPVQANVTHMSIESGHEPTTSISRRIESDGDRQISMNLPAVISSSAAERIAEERLRDAWIGRDTISFLTGSALLALSPGDVIAFDQAQEVRFQITGIETGIHRSVEARRIEHFGLSRQLVDQQRQLDNRALVLEAPELEIMDLPLLPGGSDASLVAHVGVSASPFATSYAVLTSPDEADYTTRGNVEAAATHGILLQDLPSGVIGRWDRAATLHLKLKHGQLASTERLSVLNGANVVAVRSNAGTWELIQFASAELQPDNTWLLRTLLRGQLGTDDAVSAASASGASVVLLDEAITPVDLDGSLLGVPLNWRVGPEDESYAAPSFTSRDFTHGGRSRRPLSPVHIRAVYLSNQSLRIGWVRRTRIDGDSWDVPDVPLGEAAERYAVTILSNDGEIIRRAEVTSPTFDYSVSERTSDLGSQSAAFFCEVAQIDSRGMPGTSRRTLIDPATL